MHVVMLVHQPLDCFRYCLYLARVLKLFIGDSCHSLEELVSMASELSSVLCRCKEEPVDCSWVNTALRPLV